MSIKRLEVAGPETPAGKRKFRDMRKSFDKKRPEDKPADDKFVPLHKDARDQDWDDVEKRVKKLSSKTFNVKGLAAVSRLPTHGPGIIIHYNGNEYVLVRRPKF